MDPFGQARRNMVDCQLRTFDVSDRAVLAAMDEVPREAFVPAAQQPLAYLDRALPLQDGPADDPRFMLPPMVLARLVQELGIESGMRVLDVAGGYGYSAVVLARLGADVTVVESRADLLAAAAERLSGWTGPGAIRLRSGELETGLPDEAPFGAILINGAIQEPPRLLLEQLRDGGRLACLVAEGGAGRARLYVRSGDATGFRSLFDAPAPTLAAFRPQPGFVF